MFVCVYVCAEQRDSGRLFETWYNYGRERVCVVRAVYGRLFDWSKNRFEYIHACVIL